MVSQKFFNSLPHVNDLHSSISSEQIEQFYPLFEEYKMSDTLGLERVHRHYTLTDNEVCKIQKNENDLYYTTNVQNQTPDLFPVSWVPYDSEWKPTLWASSELLPKDFVHNFNSSSTQEFFDKMYDIIDKKNQIGNLEICVVFSFPDSNMLEFTDETKRVQKLRAVPLDHVLSPKSWIETRWRFVHNDKHSSTPCMRCGTYCPLNGSGYTHSMRDEHTGEIY